MKEADARQELELDTDAASEPYLDSTDIDKLLSACLVKAPSSEGADDGEWNLSRAKGRAWRRKQGRAAQFYGTESEIYKHCKEMAQCWEGQAARTEASPFPPTVSVKSTVHW